MCSGSGKLTFSSSTNLCCVEPTPTQQEKGFVWSSLPCCARGMTNSVHNIAFLPFLGTQSNFRHSGSDNYQLGLHFCYPRLYYAFLVNFYYTFQCTFTTLFGTLVLPFDYTFDYTLTTLFGTLLLCFFDTLSTILLLHYLLHFHYTLWVHFYYTFTMQFQYTFWYTFSTLSLHFLVHFLLHFWAHFYHTFLVHIYYLFTTLSLCIFGTLFTIFVGTLCHDRNTRSPCTLLSDRIHMFAVCLQYVLPFSISLYLSCSATDQ